MSTSNYVKGACQQCAGHLEFPAAAAGETIACPHCGRPTALVATVSSNQVNAFRQLRWGTALLIFIGVAALAVGFFVAQTAHNAGVLEMRRGQIARSNTSPVLAAAPVIHPKPTIEALTNDLALLPFKLEKMPGSSLVYVTGTIQNFSSRQRFGVKVTFALFDTNSTPVGKATDYHPVLEPHGDWRFKAMIMDSKAVSARFDSIAEDQQ